MEIIKNQRGCLKLVHEGYVYTKKYVRKNVRWECANRDAFSCNGGLTTDAEMKTVISSTPHSHDPHEHSVAVTKLRATLKEHAAGSRGQLLVDHTSETHAELLAELGHPDTVKRSLRQERAKTLPKNPASLRDLTLDEKWSITSDQEQFLIHDSGADSSDRMLVFATGIGQCKI